jgi:hypothetical protein
MRAFPASALVAIIILSVPSTATPSAENQPDSQATELKLILNEICPRTSDGQTWIELLNPTNHPVALEGWSIQFASRASAAFPDDAQDCAASSGRGLPHA